MIRINSRFFERISRVISLPHAAYPNSANDFRDYKPPIKLGYKEKGTNWLEYLVCSAPKHYQPYMKLMRLDRPIGTWLLYIPCTWGIALATPIGELPSLYMLSLFATGAVLMRGAGCTINDMLDRNYDKHVERTRERPIPSGDVSLQQAFVFLTAQMGLSLIVLLQLNWHSVFLGLGSTILVVTYPLFKRFTYWPQIVLGFTFNYGALLGYSAVAGSCQWSLTLPMYICGLCWTVLYDTVYALQDIEDDKAVGLKSTAIYFGDNCKWWCSGFGVGMAGLLLLTGYNYGAGPVYYGGVSVAMLHVAYRLAVLDLNDRSQCLSTFKSNRDTGMLIFFSIVLDKLLNSGLPIF